MARAATLHKCRLMRKKPVGLIKMLNLKRKRLKRQKFKKTLMHYVCRLNVVWNVLTDWIAASAEKYLAG